MGKIPAINQARSKMNAFSSLMATIHGYERQTKEVKVRTGVIVKFPKDWQERNGRGKNTVTPPRFNMQGMQELVVEPGGSGAGLVHKLLKD
jgi:hypothetical protein